MFKLKLGLGPIQTLLVIGRNIKITYDCGGVKKDPPRLRPIKFEDTDNTDNITSSNFSESPTFEIDMPDIFDKKEPYPQAPISQPPSYGSSYSSNTNYSGNSYGSYGSSSNSFKSYNSRSQDEFWK